MAPNKIATDIKFDLNDGNQIPALGLGTVPPEDPSEVKQQVITAVKAGYRLIDTAWYYGTEKYIGEALKELFADGYKREDLYITTKVWPSLHDNPEKSLDKSLSDLGIEYVDLLLQHWPVCFKSDENGEPAVPKDGNGNVIFDDDPASGTKFIDFYNKIEDIKLNTNKARSVGVSNYSIPKLKQLLPKIKKFIPVLNQIEYHPQLPQQDLVDFCQEHGILIEAYSPVGSTGAPVLKLPYVKELANKYEVTVNQVANAYHINDGRISIPRSSNLERIKANVVIPQLSKEELKTLYQIGADKPKRYINDPWGYGLGFEWWEGDTLSKGE
ncbi:Aldo/keto reductase [Suhomyces tanzawaensis NRRL Y-17324]|uniref:2-dehydropantolactone reductase n=1 Tax=Suhomyces tanzawaensis NRRL Y-17324 TaxID=984487 RepID=A0A1E4SP37_9ASCO|nr:Aldo/keto reductase [Suhomyces tanzawaensis NRRL Y-17324]ODV81177.1 Aldo/keto reductase [Suhomyces tanzawaensis NRRL Y-17324]